MQAQQFAPRRGGGAGGRARAPPPPAALGLNFTLPSFGARAKAPPAKPLARLLELVAPLERGLAAAPPAAAAEIAACFDELAAAEAVPPPGSLTGTWKLVWTTEKETLWLLKNAGLFGTAAGDVFQVIDEAGGTLQNVVTFTADDNAFVVDSSLSREAGARRVDFKFRAARLDLPGGRALRLPPVGAGWFDCLTVTARHRVCRDVRGDLLVVERAGPPRRF